MVGRPPAKRRTAEPTITVDEQRFIVELLRVGNAAKAFGIVWPLESRPTQRAAALLKQPRIEAALREARAIASKRFGITRDRVLQEMARLAFFDPRALYHEDGRMKLMSELDADTAAAITGYETQEIGMGKDEEPALVRKVKWADKMAALNAIMKAQGWNEEKAPGTDGNPLVLLLQQMGKQSAIPVVVDSTAEEEP